MLRARVAELDVVETEGGTVGDVDDGVALELFARISEKNHAHSTLNPLAAYTKRMSLDQIMGDVMIAYPNTRPMCSANCDGAAAAASRFGAPRWWSALDDMLAAPEVHAVYVASPNGVHLEQCRAALAAGKPLPKAGA